MMFAGSERNRIQLVFLYQITYKLFDYKSSSENYQKILETNFENQDQMQGEDEDQAAALDKDEVIDVVTNFMAC